MNIFLKTRCIYMLKTCKVFVLKNIVHTKLNCFVLYLQNYMHFLSFSKAKHTKVKQLGNITDKLNDVNKKLKISQENVKAAKIGREPTREREDVLKKVAQLKAEEEALLKEIKKHETWEKMKKESEV